MTGKEIINFATSICGGHQAIIEYALMWINDGVEVLSARYNSANKVSATDYTITSAKAATPYELPANFRGVLAVKTAAGEAYSAYTVDDYGCIYFADDGSYSIRYTRAPVPLTVSSAGLDETPDLHEVYHKPLAYFVAHMDKKSRGVESDMAAIYESDFTNRAEEATRTLLSLKNKNVRIGARMYK